MALHFKRLRQSPSHPLNLARSLLCRDGNGHAMTDDSAGGEFDLKQEARYANHFYVGHNAFEVILQFGQFYEGNNQPVMHTRIVTNPAYALMLLQLLSSTMSEFEGRFGPIDAGGAYE
jgi:hypothetical protein